MKRIFMSLVLCLACFAFLFTPTTHAASNTSASKSATVKPLASGGGCHSASNGEETVNSCISIGWPTLHSDAYITIPTNTANNNCEVYVFTTTTSGSDVASQSFICYYGYHDYSLSSSHVSGSYYTYAFVTYGAGGVLASTSPNVSY